MEKLTYEELCDLADLADDHADRCDDDQEIFDRFSNLRDKLSRMATATKGESK